MCDTCGCNVTPGNKHLVEANGKLAWVGKGKTAVDVLQGLLSENDHQAMHNRQHFDKHQVLAINLMSSPGAGKTALLEATIEALQDRYRIAVIEGDLETENDAKRIRAKGVTAIQITTGTACHLDAHMVHDALHNLDLSKLDIVFIENVGNLVCPASFDLGHHRNVTLLSVPEGDDKPAKYPVMFRAADLMLLTKTDLLAVLDDFKPEKAEQYLRNLASEAPVMQVSSRSGEGMQDWLDWLDQELATHRARIQNGEIVRPAIQSDGIRLHATANSPTQHHGPTHRHE
ncbi:hydrogenase nickel incorporation protein HypB [Sulfuriflexus mobilis]|uniref:hydrogenase nickel incorporation protein HypB n=1 Tax=Sulfuriflexus mobilis TaxID=1811807 RepID=UPI000F834DBC|nr:hydrogenase nickel incorporation protein HypB [Sulfuriflexus mobilis]